MYNTVFGVAAARDERAHLIPHNEARGSLPQMSNLARDFEPRNAGDAWGRRVHAAPLQDVRAIDAGRLDLDQNASFRGLGNRA